MNGTIWLLYNNQTALCYQYCRIFRLLGTFPRKMLLLLNRIPWIKSNTSIRRTSTVQKSPSSKAVSYSNPVLECLISECFGNGFLSAHHFFQIIFSIGLYMFRFNGWCCRFATIFLVALWSDIIVASWSGFRYFFVRNLGRFRILNFTCQYSTTRIDHRSPASLKSSNRKALANAISNL